MDFKLTITKDQIVKSSVASKNFYQYTNRAKIEPIYISENGNIDTVLIGYNYFEQILQRLSELEELQEVRILSERIDRLEDNPSLSVLWKDVKRTGK